MNKTGVILVFAAIAFFFFSQFSPLFAVISQPSTRSLPSGSAVIFLGYGGGEQAFISAPVDVSGLDLGEAALKSGRPVEEMLDAGKAFGGGVARASFPSGAQVSSTDSCPRVRSCVASAEVNNALRKYSVVLARTRASVANAFLLACNVAAEESCYGRYGRSRAGALGVMQIMPDTGRGECGLSTAQLNDIDRNVWCGTKYLAELLGQFGDTKLALAAYNAGPGRVRRAGGVPHIAETLDYVASICGNYGYCYA